MMESRGIYMSARRRRRQAVCGGLLPAQRPHRRRGHRVADGRCGRTTPAEFDAVRRPHHAVPGLPPRAGAARHRASVRPPAREWGDNDANRAVRSRAQQGPRGASPGSMRSAPSTSMPRSTQGIDRTAWLHEPARRLRGAAGGRRRLHDLARVARPLADITPGHRGGRRRRRPSAPSPTASAATRSARWRARSRCSRTPCARNDELNQHRRRRRRRRAPTARSGWRPRSRQFGADVEATLAELGRISDQMLAASTRAVAAPPTTPRRGPRAPPPPPPRPPPMCATSRPPPTSSPPR